MKNITKFLGYIAITLLPIGGLLAGCGTQQAIPTTNAAAYNNGMYGQYGNQYGNQYGMNGYRYVNGMCVGPTGQQVQPQMCQQMGQTGMYQNGMGGGVQCYGQFYYAGNLYTCQGMNCSGFTMVNAMTGMQQYCM